MTVDTKRGIVYVPTGSAVFDFYGGDRVGDDLFADTLLALDAETGKRIWHFQGVHHDLWDRDFPAPPALLTVTRDGKRVDADCPDDQVGLCLPSRSHHREAALPAQGVGLSRQQCSRRSYFADPVAAYCA